MRLWTGQPLSLGYRGGSCEGGDEYPEKTENFVASFGCHLLKND
jgi:hypothetical protein